eukprot:snap_masked-scaffold_1-processed-gene-16.35-mRNA-1 protein AED:1.00 eAED:1.00 QI:0/0/0/0/1/1/3/0/363
MYYGKQIIKFFLSVLSSTFNHEQNQGFEEALKKRSVLKTVHLITGNKNSKCKNLTQVEFMSDFTLDSMLEVGKVLKRNNKNIRQYRNSLKFNDESDLNKVELLYEIFNLPEKSDNTSPLFFIAGIEESSSMRNLCLTWKYVFNPKYFDTLIPNYMFEMGYKLNIPASLSEYKVPQQLILRYKGISLINVKHLLNFCKCDLVKYLKKLVLDVTFQKNDRASFLPFMYSCFKVVQKSNALKYVLFSIEDIPDFSIRIKSYIKSECENIIKQISNQVSNNQYIGKRFAEPYTWRSCSLEELDFFLLEEELLGEQLSQWYCCDSDGKDLPDPFFISFHRERSNEHNVLEVAYYIPSEDINCLLGFDF